MAQFFEMPQASPTMEAGTLLSWKKKEGESLKPQDVIAEVETDKAAMDIEVFDAGVLLKILAAEGEEVPIMRAAICALGVLALVAGGPNSAQAGIVTYSLSGTVSVFTDTSSNHFVPTSIHDRSRSSARPTMRARRTGVIRRRMESAS